MKIKQLESWLSDLRPFDKPKVELEQYPTSASIAARVLSVCEDQFGDVRHKVVVDMGCGAGMLTAAAAVLEADQVIGIDIDPDALETARDNLDSFEGIEAAVELVESDVAQAPKFLSCYHHRAQTVISNPPFGTRCKGADVAFIEAAFRLAPGGVLYSLHKARIGLNIRSMSCMQPGHATLPRAPGPCRPAPGSTWPRWGRAWARTGVAPSRK